MADCGGGAGGCGCAGTCGGESTSDARRVNADALNWGRFLADSSPCLSPFWRQALIGDTLRRTTGETISSPLLGALSQLPSSFWLEDYDSMPPVTGSLPSGGASFTATSGQRGFTMGVPGSIGRTTLDDDGCDSLWWIPGLNIPGDLDTVGGSDPSVGSAANDKLSSGPRDAEDGTLSNAAYRTSQAHAIDTPDQSVPLTEAPHQLPLRLGVPIGALPGAAHSSKHSALPPEPPPTTWGVPGVKFAGCASYGCPLCVPRAAGMGCMCTDPSPPEDPPPPDGPAGSPPPPYHEECIVDAVTYVEAGPPWRSWSFDEDLARSREYRGWMTPTLGPNRTKGFARFMDNQRGPRVGYRFELWVFYTGNWDLCTWGQIGIEPMVLILRAPSGNERRWPRYPEGYKDMGNAPGYGRAHHSHNETYYGGGKFSAYDVPGTIVEREWGLGIRWRIRGWAKGTDGVEKEDTMRIRMDITIPREESW